MDETTLGDRQAPVRLRPFPGPAMVAAAATLFALLPGLYHLDRVGFWYDEAQTVGTVDRPFGDALWRITHWEVNQSPFYLLATAWIRLGDSEAFLRLLSLGVWVGRSRCSSSSAAAWSTRGSARSRPWPTPCTASRWSRPSSSGATRRPPSSPLATLAPRPLARSAHHPAGVIYGLVAALAAYAHFFALLVLAAHVVTGPGRGAPPAPTAFVVAGVVAASPSPLSRLPPHRWTATPSAGWRTRPAAS